MQNGKVKFKARLVFRGFEQRYGINYKETFAPTASYQSIRILLAISARMKLKIHQMDVKTAFINAPLNEIVHIHKPEGLTSGTSILRLRKALYGLKQAPRAWNELINSRVTTSRFRRLLLMLLLKQQTNLQSKKKEVEYGNVLSNHITHV